MNGNAAYSSKLSQHTPKSVISVAILGAESTGKTTLCKDLAAYFGSPWVPEFMREYLQEKWDSEQLTCTFDDLLPIAAGQMTLENTAAAQEPQYLFCDTSLFELMVYSNLYYGDCPPALTDAALAHHYDLVLLTEVDIPWEPDDLRDSPNGREDIAELFAAELTRHGKLFRRIGGTRQARVAQVAEWLAELR